MTKILFILLISISVIACQDNAEPNITGKKLEIKQDENYVEMKDAISIIHKRKSVRKYTDQPVTKNQLEELLRAGMAAPTAMNLQAWFYISISKTDVLQDLSEMLPYGKMLDHAAAAIVVCGDITDYSEDASEYWVQDCSAATQNILLAVEAMELGAVWIGVYPNKERTSKLKSYFDLPDNIIPFSVISIGYPDGEHIPKDKWKPEKIMWIE